MVEVGFYTIVARVYHIKPTPCTPYLSAAISCDMRKLSPKGVHVGFLLKDTVVPSP
jgi:hypothetical protein